MRVVVRRKGPGTYLSEKPEMIEMARHFRASMQLLVTLHLLSIALILGAVPIRADEASMWAGSATRPVPEGAKVTLELDRPDYFLGENVLVHFVLHNTGDVSFEASWGGDYRGASRQLRFRVIATDEVGEAAEDPDPSPMCMGGRGGPMTLKPGEKYNSSLPLMRYCDIVTPGVYTIQATHDFGWKEGKRKRPVGEAKITFRLPNSQQAKRVVSEMASLPKWPNSSWGKRSTAYADFRCLRHPIYLDILASRARDGDKRILEGLGQIPTVEASMTLIQLAGNPNKELALGAAKTLNARLPYPESHYIWAPPDSPKDPTLSIRGRLVERAWDKTLVPDVRRLAARLLANEDLAITAAGAFMITSVGIKEDASVVLAAINQARNPTHKNRTDPKDNILDTPQPIRELLRAMDALRTRGYSLGRNVSGDAEILLYFHILRNDASPRPKRYRQFLEAFGTASWPPIREAAVRSIPKGIPSEYTRFVLERLEDKDLGVCRAACSAAGMSKDTQFLQPLLDLIATEKHEWLLREASNAAQTLARGTGFALLEVWADRLVDADLYPLALDALQNVLDVPSGGHSGRTDLSRAERLKLRKAWKAFLALHADEIRAGKCFDLSNPVVTPALVGRARSWRLPDGRLHLHHGPIDLIVEAFGQPPAIESAYQSAQAQFQALLPELVQDLGVLKQPLSTRRPEVQGRVAQRMVNAVWPYRGVYVTPMAAVAGQRPRCP